MSRAFASEIKLVLLNALQDDLYLNTGQSVMCTNGCFLIGVNSSQHILV